MTSRSSMACWGKPVSSMFASSSCGSRHGRMACRVTHLYGSSRTPNISRVILHNNEANILSTIAAFSDYWRFDSRSIKIEKAVLYRYE